MVLSHHFDCHQMSYKETCGSTISAGSPRSETRGTTVGIEGYINRGEVGYAVNGRWTESWARTMVKVEPLPGLL